MRGRGSAGRFRGSNTLSGFSRQEVEEGEIHTNIPALAEKYANEEYDQEEDGADPTVGGVRGAFVEIGLI